MSKLLTLIRRCRDRLRQSPPRGPHDVDWGALRTHVPKCSDFGYSRGLPVDRYYIEKFIESHATDIRGRVLELLRDTYASRFGGSQVTKLDIMNLKPGPKETTIVADLSNCPEIPDGSFDTIILTQALHCIPDLEATIAHLHRLLSPGGTLLATAPSLSPNVAPETGEYPDLWRFFPGSLQWLFEKQFPSECLQVSSVGNLLAATAFLHGLAANELSTTELDYHDPRLPLLVTVHARKPD